MKRTALLLMILLLLCPAAQADLFIDLAPGGVTVLPPEGAPFRTEPDARAEPLFNIGPGVNLTLLSVDRETNWAYVLLVVTTPKAERHFGYVRPGALINGDYLSADACRIVNPNPGERLNLRTGPSPDAESLGQYYTGVLVKNYHQEKNGYLRVCIGNRVGYMDKRYLVAYDSTAASEIPLMTIQNSGGSGANLRLEPGMQGKLLGLYPNGTEAAVLGTAPGGWLHVMIHGATGFMAADLLADSF